MAEEAAVVRGAAGVAVSWLVVLANHVGTTMDGSEDAANSCVRMLGGTMKGCSGDFLIFMYSLYASCCWRSTGPRGTVSVDVLEDGLESDRGGGETDVMRVSRRLIPGDSRYSWSLAGVARSTRLAEGDEAGMPDGDTD